MKQKLVQAIIELLIKVHKRVSIAAIYIENRPMLKLLIEMTIELLLSM